MENVKQIQNHQTQVVLLLDVKLVKKVITHIALNAKKDMALEVDTALYVKKDYIISHMMDNLYAWKIVLLFLIVYYILKTIIIQNIPTAQWKMVNFYVLIAIQKIIIMKVMTLNHAFLGLIVLVILKAA